MLSDPKPRSGDTILEDLPFYLARAGISFRRFNDRTLRAVGLKSQAPGVASVLHALAEHDNCTVSSLVERTHLPNGTLSGLLNSLEKDGCLRRVHNPEDGRSWRIQLTLKGRQVEAKLNERHRMVLELFRAVLSEAETAELKRLLERVTQCMRDYGADDVQSPVRVAPPRHAEPDPARHFIS